MATPHDDIFHRTFANRTNGPALFRLALPPKLVAAIDWRTLTARPCRFTDARLKKRFADHLYSVRLRHYDLTLMLLPEHKSRRDSGYVLQQLDYVVTVLQFCAENTPAWKGLPPVIPVLFHNGDKPWRTPSSLRHHFDRAGLRAVREKDPDLAAIIESLSVSMPSSVVDMAPLDEDWLRAVPLPNMVKLVLLCMRVLRFEDPAEVAATLERWRDLLVAVDKAPMGRGKLGGLERYLVQLDKLGYDQLLDIVQRTTGSGDKLMSIAERLRKEGEALGRLTTLLRLLQRRFGELPKSIVRRVQAAKIAELERWTDRVLDAKTLQAVFAAD